MNEKKWVTAWGNAISISERRPENYAKDLTLRYPVRITVSGEKLRFTFDNFCGHDAVTLTRANVAFSLGDDVIAEESIKSLTFNGSSSVVIPAGGTVKSDPLDFPVKCGDNVAVSMYFSDFTEMRSGVVVTGPLSCGYFAVGDRINECILNKDLSKKTNTFYFLSDIEIYADKNTRTLVCYGDSITAQAWPDYLIDRAIKISGGRTAVIRKAASGTRILRQYDNITYDSYGLKGETRFPREVFVSGADTVIIQHGINDIIHPVGSEVNPFRPWSDLPTAEEMIDGLRFYIETARLGGLKPYLGTLLPIKGWRTYADFREKLRCEVNEWIRMNNEADGYIDFDKAVCNPSCPSAFADGYDSGDHLHPSSAAYKRMAEEVPEKLLK